MGYLRSIFSIIFANAATASWLWEYLIQPLCSHTQMSPLMFSLLYKTSIYPNSPWQEMDGNHLNKLVINTIISNLNHVDSRTF